MNLLDRFPNSGGLDSFNSSPERKLCSEYYKVRQMRLDKEIGSMAQYLSIRIDENGEFVPCFAAEALPKIKQAYEEIAQLRAQEAFLLGQITRIDNLYPDMDIRELHRQSQELVAKVKGLQLFPIELEEARQKHATLERQISEYTTILSEQYPGTSP